MMKWVVSSPQKMYL